MSDTADQTEAETTDEVVEPDTEAAEVEGTDDAEGTTETE